MNFLDELEQTLKKDLKEEVTFLIEDGDATDVKHFVSTGSSLLNYIISNRRDGGIPIGKITEISGLEGTGKSLLAMQICAEAVKMGGSAVFIDTEHAFNSEFALRVGLKEGSNFRVMRPSSVEGVFETLFKIIHSLDEKKKSKETKIPFLIFVWDSVAQTPCKADLDSESTDPTATVGLKPRVLSKNIATLLGSTGRRNVGSVFLNQLRTNIGARPGQDKWVTPGGKAIPFASSVRVRLANAGKVKESDAIRGINVLAKCVKTRFGPPYRQCNFPLYFTHGVDDWESIIDGLCDKEKVIKASRGRLGTTYRFFDEEKEAGVSKLEFKRKLKTDQILGNKAKDLLEGIMTVDLFDPDNASIEIVEAENVEVL